MDKKLKVYEEKARLASIKDHCVQHVNLKPNGNYTLSDWFDFDETMASYEDGIKIF